MRNNQQTEQNKKSKLTAYLKKLGLAGFMFFLIKGLIWTGVFIFGAKSCQNLF